MSVSIIKDYVIVQPKSKIKAGEGLIEGKYKFFTSSNTQTKWLNEFYYDKPALIFGTGGMASVHYCDTPFSTSTDCIVMYAKDSTNLEYIYHYLESHMEVLEDGFKGAGLKHISKDYVLNIQIPEKELLEQKKIVDLCNNIDLIVAASKKQLEKLDELVKSRFIELFGDPKSNPDSYDIIPFNDCIEYMGDIGSNGANKVVVERLDMKDEEDYALMVRFLNFTKNDFTNDVKYVSKEAYDFFKKSQIFGGELIICKIGSAGQNYVMPYLNRPVSLGLNQIMVRINSITIMPYLYQYLNTDYGKQLIEACINGAVTKSITKTELKKLPVIVPPLDLQNKFADFVKQVDKSKFEVQQSLKKLETLKKSLMQKYFE